MNKNRWTLLTMLLIFFGSMVISEAQRRGGSRSVSRSASRPSPTKFSSRPSRTNRATKPTARPSASKSSNTFNSRKKPVKSQRQIDKETKYNKAKNSGRRFDTRSQAKAHLNKKVEGGSYKSKFDKEPASRPKHIPRQYEGRDVSYSPERGGYGYMGSGGAWMAYSVARDAVMMNALLNNNYHVGGPPVVHSAHSSGGFSTLGFLMVIGVGGLCLFCVVMAVRF